MQGKSTAGWCKGSLRMTESQENTVKREEATIVTAIQTGSNETQPTECGARWSNVQAYGLGVVCLVLGIGLGFLYRGSASAPQPNNVSEQVSMAAPGPQTTVTPEQLKNMAEKAVQPELEQLKQKPNDAKLLAEIGNKYYAGHQFESAIEYYTKSVEAKADPDVLVQLANAQHYSGADDKAIATLNRALEIDPKFANAMFNLAMLKWKAQGDSAGAIREWQLLLKTYPNHPNRAQVEQMIARVQQQAAAE